MRLGKKQRFQSVRPGDLISDSLRPDRQAACSKSSGRGLGIRLACMLVFGATCHLDDKHIGYFRFGQDERARLISPHLAMTGDGFQLAVSQFREGQKMTQGRTDGSDARLAHSTGPLCRFTAISDWSKKRVIWSASPRSIISPGESGMTASLCSPLYISSGALTDNRALPVERTTMMRLSCAISTRDCQSAASS